MSECGAAGSGSNKCIRPLGHEAPLHCDDRGYQWMTSIAGQDGRERMFAHFASQFPEPDASALPTRAEWELVVKMIEHAVARCRFVRECSDDREDAVLVLGTCWATFMPRDGLAVRDRDGETYMLRLSHIEGRRRVQIVPGSTLLCDPNQITAYDIAATRAYLGAIDRLKRAGEWTSAAVLRFHPEHAGHTVRETTRTAGDKALSPWGCAPGSINLLCSCGWTLRITEKELAGAGFREPGAEVHPGAGAAVTSE